MLPVQTNSRRRSISLLTLPPHIRRTALPDLTEAEGPTNSIAGAMSTGLNLDSVQSVSYSSPSDNFSVDIKSALGNNPALFFW